MDPISGPHEGGESVVLHVYDLSQGHARLLSLQLLGKAIDAVYHTGVVVYGQEFSFGAGIESEQPERSRYGVPIQRLPMGRTEVPQEMFLDFLSDIRPRYTSETYNLMRHNCNNFSDEVAQFLVGLGVPKHILDLPNEVLNTPMGAMLIPMIEQMDLSRRATPNPSPLPLRPSPALTSTPSPIPINSFSRSELTPAAPTTNGAMGVPPGAAPPGAPSKSARSAQGALSGGGRQSMDSESGEGHGNGSVITAEGSVITAEESGRTLVKDESAAKVRLHQEISTEFSGIMGKGGLTANEAAVEAMRRVVERHRGGGQR